MPGPIHNKMLWLTAAAAVAATTVPASAEVYLTESQALGTILGDKAVLRREQKILDSALRKRLEEATALRFPETSITFFIAAQDGKPTKYAVAMNEIGKSEPITFMVGMSPEGKVTEVVIMEFRENRGWEVKEKRFLNQFRGKTAKSSIRVDEDIVNYTGATLSSKAVARGVKRALFLLDAFYPGEARYKLSAARDFALPAELKPIAVAGTLGLYRQTRYAMGTHCEIRTWCDSASRAYAAFKQGFGELERIEQVFSAYREDSELSYVNKNAGKENVRVSREFFEVAQLAVQASEQTDGVVNLAVGPIVELWKRCEEEQRWPTAKEIAGARALTDVKNVQLKDSDQALRLSVPGMKLDFGGIAKGYAAERVARLLEKSGAVSALVNLGRSSICASRVSGNFAGHDAQDNLSRPIDAWQVAILEPSETSGVAEIFSLGPGESASTSGTTERGFLIRGERLSHVLNPMTGFPLQSVRSATVVGRNGIRAEVASKVLLFVKKSSEFQPLAAEELRYWTRIERTGETV